MSDWKFGSIKTLVKDYGFINCPADGNDYFFHESKVEDNDSLKVGSSVKFILSDFIPKGKNPSAEKVALNKESKSSSPVNKKLKYYFIDKVDLFSASKFLLKHLLANSEDVKKCYTEPEPIIERYNKLIRDNFKLFDSISDIQDINSINNNFKRNFKTEDAALAKWSKTFDLQEFGSELEIVSSIPHDKGKRKLFEIIWGEWRDNEEQIYTSGYMEGYFNYSFSSPGEADESTVYLSPPPPASWDLIEINQKGNIFYIASAPVKEIAQSSSVPSIPPQLGIIETSKRIIDKKRGESEWQRLVDLKRVRKITNFIGAGENIIANSIMLFINDEKSTEIKNNQLIIHFDKFLKKEKTGDNKDKFIDRKLRVNRDEFDNPIYDDFRPLWIIDGQHRVKGMFRNSEMNDLVIPLVIFPKNFKSSKTAKLFAEINTLQQPLDSLHELFMQHRFSIDSTNIKRRFRDFRSTSFEIASNENWHKAWLDSRANHLSYEVLAKLAQEGPLKDKVQFLKQNIKSTKILVSADQWVNYSRGWFINGPYKYISENIKDYISSPTKDELDTSLEDIFYTEINNYFFAWEKISNHGKWENNKDRWVLRGNEKALIQKLTYFIILLEIYGTVHHITKNRKDLNRETGLLNTNDFLETLKPFKWVDWIHKDIINAYPGSGEVGRRALEVWLCDALLHGKQYKPDQIINTSIKSKPGRGITSELEKANLKIISDLKWPTKEEDLKIESFRPYNARYEAEWSIQDENGDVIDKKKSNTSRHGLPIGSTIAIKSTTLKRDDIKQLHIRVDWSNMHTNTGHNTLILDNPKFKE